MAKYEIRAISLDGRDEKLVLDGCAEITEGGALVIDHPVKGIIRAWSRGNWYRVKRLCPPRSWLARLFG